MSPVGQFDRNEQNMGSNALVDMEACLYSCIVTSVGFCIFICTLVYNFITTQYDLSRWNVSRGFRLLTIQLQGIQGLPWDFFRRQRIKIYIMKF
jgi:hypothetical protein